MALNEGSPCHAQHAAARPDALTVLTGMQWFYGPTWGSTLRLCGPRSPSSCAQWEEVHNRQMELFEVLRRNVAHPHVQEVHVLVGESEPVQQFLERLPWYQRRGCMVHLVSTHKRPKFSDYMEYINERLLGRTVVITNQDVFLGDGWWGELPTSLPLRTAYLLSRYHLKVSYDTQHVFAAGTELGVFNATTNRKPQRSNQKLVALQRVPSQRRVCDMGAPRMALWSRSLCGPNNFGSYDAYVLRLVDKLSPREIDLFDYPQNAWGGENVFQYLLQAGLELQTRNPCLGLKVVHMHCELPTTFNDPKVGDRRLGKREIALVAQRKLIAMGKKPTVSINDMGLLKLNVTYT